ncbi:hypothetical protein ACFPMF_18685 [Larkinella bovis]|uniref:Uncharacterized protein n=1 Tax=Larkinella bovis TaxID=683041 RepID=A0ABW0ID74_9BACT
MRILPLRALFRFYRTVWVFSNVVTLSLIGFSLNRILPYFSLFLVYFLWLKVLSNLGIGYIARQKYRDQYWFYHNLGLSETALFSGAFALDLLIAFLLIGSVYQVLLLL